MQRHLGAQYAIQVPFSMLSTIIAFCGAERVAENLKKGVSEAEKIWSPPAFGVPFSTMH